MSNSHAIETSQVCRTCMSPSKDLKSLYEASNTRQTCLVELLMALTPLKCFIDDGFPTHICNKCICEITNFDNFRLKCLETDRLLRNNLENSINAQVFTDFELLINNESQENEIKNVDYSEVSAEEDYLTLKDPLEINTHTDVVGHIDSTNPDTNFDGKCDVQHKLTSKTVIEFTKCTAPDEKTYTCLICNTAYDTKQGLQRHLRKHTGKKPYACPKCDRSFTRNDVLTLHKRRKHSDTQPYSCTLCSNSFQRKSSLSVHLRSHIGAKPYACTRCDSKFSRKEHVALHMRTHTGEKPFACVVCNHSFNRKENLTVHIRKHTGEKPFACSLCDKSFKHNSSLINHELMHTGGKSYACVFCDLSFPLKSRLTAHLRTHKKKTTSSS